jgi:hypothetical protein
MKARYLHYQMLYREHSISRFLTHTHTHARARARRLFLYDRIRFNITAPSIRRSVGCSFLWSFSFEMSHAFWIHPVCDICTYHSRNIQINQKESILTLLSRFYSCGNVYFKSVVAKQSTVIYQSIAASFFKIAYLKRNWRCKLGMHELSSAERNARYRRFFELLNNPPGLYQVILNLLSVNYRKICSVINQLHNRKVSEKRLLIMVNCFSLKRSVFNKRNNRTFICLMLLCYFKFHWIVDLILNYVLW